MFPLRIFFGKCDQIHRKLRIWSTDLVTFTEESLNEKRHFLCSDVMCLVDAIPQAVSNFSINTLQAVVSSFSYKFYTLYRNFIHSFLDLFAKHNFKLTKICYM